MSESSSTVGFGPLPLTIGVTGHRDLRPEDDLPLRQAVARIFAELREKLPCTPFLLLSPLAEGADCLVADVALAQRATRAIAILPFDRDLYVEDFSFADGPGTQDEGLLKSANPALTLFDDLLARCERVVTVPPLPGETRALIEQPGPWRDRKYEQAGHFVALNCHILIALWDGERTGKTGGTAQVIDAKLASRLPSSVEMRSPLDRAEAGVVYHIVTPRRSSAVLPANPLALRVLHPKPWTEGLSLPASEEAAVLDHIERFNLDAARQATHHRAWREEALHPLSSAGLQTGHLASTLDLFAIADQLSRHYSKQTTRYIFSIFGLGVLSIVLLSLHEHLEHESILSHVLFGAYVGLAALAYGIWWVGKRLRWQDKFQDYRALAEGARVQIYWRLAGVKASTADFYLNGQADELDWIRRALRTAALQDRSEGQGPDISTLRTVAQTWIGDQIAYFLGRGRDDKRSAVVRSIAHKAKILKWAKIGVVTGMLISGITFSLKTWDILLRHDVQLVLGVTSSFCLAVAAAFGAYVNVMAYSEQSLHYVSMTRTYRFAADALTELFAASGRIGDLDLVSRARRILQDLGQEALIENGQWLIVHRQRPIKPKP